MRNFNVLVAYMIEKLKKKNIEIRTEKEMHCIMLEIYYENLQQSLIIITNENLWSMSKFHVPFENYYNFH